MSARRWAPLLLASALAAAPTAAAAEREAPVLLLEQAAGAVAADGATGVLVQGFTGTVAARSGKPGELRFTSVAGATGAPERRVRLWRDGDAFRLEPSPRAGADEGGELEVIVPEPLRVAIRLTGARLRATGLRSGLDVEGSELDVEVRGTTGGGALRLVSSRVELTRIGALDADLTDTTLTIVDATAPVRVRATGGRADVTGLQQGGELKMSGAPLALRRSTRGVSIESDGEVRLSDTAGETRVRGFGGSVRASRNAGPLEVRMDGGEVTVDGSSGPVRVEGRRLEVALKGVSGGLTADVGWSAIEVDDPAGPVSLILESSDATIRRAVQEVDVRAKGGTLRIADLRGSAQVRADVDHVEISWAALFPTKDSFVSNAGGSVEMLFPAAAALAIAATTKHGRIDSRLPGLPVEDDAASVEGVIGPDAGRRSVKIEASGDVVLGPAPF